MRIVDHLASLAAGRAGWRGGKYSKHCSLPSALITNVTAPAGRLPAGDADRGRRGRQDPVGAARRGRTAPGVPRRVWLVQLDQVRDEGLVAQAVAGALGLQDRAGYTVAADASGTAGGPPDRRWPQQ